MELFQRTFFSSVTHPGKQLDVLLHGRFNVLHHSQSAGLSFRSESALNIDLPKSFAQIVVSGLHAALPACAQLFLSAELFAIKIKILKNKCPGQHGRKRTDQMPAQISFDGGQVLLLYDSLQAFKKIGNSNIQALDDGRASGAQVAVPVECRIHAGQIA